MKEFLGRNKIDIVIIVFIAFVSLFIRIIRLGTIPPNISGDEVTILSDIYKIPFTNNNYLLSFMGDGSIPGINFYLPSLYIKLLGIKNSIFALRLYIETLSLLSLVPFYFILKNKTTILISFIFTLLLSVNFTFLNFSRTAWIHMTTICFGLALILILEKAEKENRFIWYGFAGVLAGITLYGYQYGRILVTGIIFYLISRFIFAKNKHIFYFKKFLLFITITIIISLPFFIAIFQNKGEAIARRPLALYAFSPEKLSNSSFTILFLNQLELTVRGFIFLDPLVMNNGIENQRYVPQNSPPVDNLIRIIFILGFIYFFIRKRFMIWWFVFFPILITQIITDLPPNFSRGFFYVPFIYLVSGIFISDILKYSNKFRIEIQYFLKMALILMSFIIFIYDINLYTSWMKSNYAYDVRQPAIDYREFPMWQEYQIKRIKLNLNPVTNYDWYEIRKILPLR